MTNITFKKKNEAKKYCDLLIGEFFIYGNHLFVKVNDISSLDISSNVIEQFNGDEIVEIPDEVNIDVKL